MITNITKKAILSKKEKHLLTTAQQARGLMFQFRPQTLVFHFKRPKKISLHMFFVFFPIDIIFLNSACKVVESKKNFLPFAMYTSKKTAQYLIEAPSGTIHASRTTNGDFVKIRQ
jgi:uncharacterized protein